MSEKDKAERPTVDTGGGAYVGGDVHTGGGDFVGRDQVTALGTQQGATAQEFLQLLAEMRQLLPQSGLDADTEQVIEGDFRVLEEQAQKPQPNSAIILSKLESVTKLLTTAVTASEAAQKLLPMAQRALDWAGQLFR